MLDKRKEPRKKLVTFTLVHDLRSKILLGYLVDLTLHGAQVEGERPVEVNQSLTLSIAFPSGLPEMTTSPFLISARVARCHKNESGSYYNIGFEFTEISPEQTKVIDAIIQRYSFHEDMQE